MKKCHYCVKDATCTLVWLLDKHQQPKKTKLPWCGCPLQEALKRFWAHPYTVVEGKDYEIEYDDAWRHLTLYELSTAVRINGKKLSPDCIKFMKQLIGEAN